MDGNQFDDLTRGLAGLRSRRGVLKALAGALLGAVGGLAGIEGAGANPPPKKCKYQGSNCSGNADPDYDYTAFPEIEAAAADAYAQAGVTDPRGEIAMAEVHDCFTPAELLIMEDLGFAERGTAWKEVLAGTYDLHGELPVNPDGGLKSFGHPVGASGLRMMFEAWLQLRHQAPEERQITTDRTIGLTHNLGGYPGEMVSFVGLVSPELG